MDNIWIILLIAGAVISLTQKEGRKRHGGGTEPESAPQDGESPLKEWRRMLSEALGEEETPAPHPAKTPMPTATPAAPTTPAEQDAATAHPVTEASHSYGQTAMPHRHNAAIPAPERRKAGTAAERSEHNASRHAAASSHAKHEGNDIARIIDDFDMERAVIYSEILKPKFEEY